MDETKFKNLLKRLSNSPLYKGKLSDYDLSRIGLRQLHTLPLTTKEDLREAGVFGTLAVDIKEVAQYHESTGTTGEPSASWFTLKDLWIGGRQLNECGVRLMPGDLVLIRFPYALALPAFLMTQAAWQSGAGVVPASGRTAVTPYPKVLRLMQQLRVTVLAGLPREMELLAETARLLGMTKEKDFPALRAICIAGELVGSKRREHIEKLWGVRVFNMYGSTETANIAVMCEYGKLHIEERDFIVEVLNEDGSDYVPPGEKGYAAITTLSHEASPLLRYFNGDVVSVLPTMCPCGRTGSELTHYGRGKDRIYFGSIVLDPLDIQDAVYSLAPPPDAWRAEEREDGLHVLLDSHRHQEWQKELLRSQLSSRLRVPVTVEIVTDTTLLNRSELVQLVPSTKPVYIRKLKNSGRPEAQEIVNQKELLRWGRRKLSRGEYEKARELFQRAVMIDPGDAEAHTWLAAAYGRLLEAGSMLEKMRLLPKLEEEIAHALRLDPMFPMARRVNGARLLYTPEELGGDPAAAVEELRYAIEHGEDDADVWVNISECYIKLGKPEQAEAALKEALVRESAHERARKLLEGEIEVQRKGVAQDERKRS